MMNTKVSKFINKIIAAIILLLAYYFLYHQLFVLEKIKPLLEANYRELNTSFLIIACVLMPLNWGLESLKWKYLLRAHEEIAFLKAFQAVLAGTTVGLFTPNRMGEFFGRVFILKKTSPITGILITIIGSIAQLLTTIVVGSLALLILIILIPGFHSDFAPALVWVFWGMTLIANVVFVMLYLNVPFISNLLQSIIKPRWINIRKYMRLFAGYSTKELFNIFFISILRYLVFTVQYIIILKMFSIPVGFFMAFFIVALIFLLISAVPTIALSELGVRGSVSLFVFGMWAQATNIDISAYEAGLVASAGLIWLINIVIPALAGSFFLFSLRFIRKNG